jgi:hypothetical protein
MSQGKAWSWSGLAFVIVSAFVGALVYRYTNKVAAHIEGNFGYVPDPAATREFLRQLEKPTFRQAGADVIAGAKGQDAYLYRYADRAHKAVYGTPFGPWNQGQAGTCVSFGWAMGSYIGQCVDWSTGQLPHPPLEVATEPIYGGSRTEGRLPPVSFAGFSDGSYGAAAARWVSGLKNGHGGILYRQKYDGADLTTYSIPLSRQWGAYGVPGQIAKEANAHTAKAVALIETWQGLCAAIESGMPVPICSNVGFANQDRDADGFVRRSGSWGHCMVVIAVKYAKNSGTNGEPKMENPRDGVLVLNSWGPNWIKGGKHPSDQPDGSFWITRADAEAILSQGDSFVIGGNGFRYRDLNNGEWLAPVPVESLSRKADGEAASFQLGL